MELLWEQHSEKIESTLRTIQPIINDIDEYNKWLDRPKEMGPIKNLLDEGKVLVEKCLRIHPLNLCKKCTHSKKLTQFDEAVRGEFQIYMPLLATRNTAAILVQIEEMRGELKLICSGQVNGGALQSRLGASGNLAAPEAPNLIVGLEVEASLRILKERLLEEGVSVIVVTAPAGCGKTTLLKKLCHDVDIEGKFKDNIMFVPVSKKPNLIDIVQRMIQHNGFAVPVIETEDVAVHYLQQLLYKVGQNPVLLVLDDVWTESQSFLEKFVFRKIKDYKIVVTSRYKFPAFPHVHRLNPLTHGEALELFRQSVTVDDRSMVVPDDELVDQIVRRCKGLPLALTVIAKSLRGKDRSFWQRKLLDWSEGHSLLDSDSGILDCLRKSLEDLDGDPSIKKRFMDLGSFPEDQMISATALIDIWVELYELDFSGVRAITDLHELVYRNLADLVVTSTVTAHDLQLYCVPHCKVQMIYEVLENMPGNRTCKGKTIQAHPLKHIYEFNKHTMDLKNTNKGLPNKKQGMILLVDLSDSFQHFIDTAAYIKNRRDSSDDGESCSGHYAMQHDLLRELAIIECNRGNVEKRERLILDLIGNNFPDWWSEQKQQSFGARLVSISTDGTFSTPWPNLELPKAEALVLNFHNNMQTKTYALPEFIEKAYKLKALIVTNYSFFPVELGNFHVIGSNLRRIRLECVRAPFLSMGNLRLHNLQKLSFSMCGISQASTSDDAKISDAMPNLLELDIDYCNDLVSLPDDICQIKPLIKLSITNCHNFSALPEEIGRWESLDMIRLNSCTNLTQLPGSIVSLQKLTLLNISDCLNLSNLPDQIGQMVNLKKMNMRGCPGLSMLPPSIVNLSKLRKVVCDKEQADMWGPFKNSLNRLQVITSE